MRIANTEEHDSWPQLQERKLEKCYRSTPFEFFAHVSGTTHAQIHAVLEIMDLVMMVVTIGNELKINGNRCKRGGWGAGSKLHKKVHI